MADLFLPITAANSDAWHPYFQLYKGGRLTSLQQQCAHPSRVKPYYERMLIQRIYALQTLKSFKVSIRNFNSPVAMGREFRQTPTQPAIYYAKVPFWLADNCQIGIQRSKVYGTPVWWNPKYKFLSILGSLGLLTILMWSCTYPQAI